LKKALEDIGYTVADWFGVSDPHIQHKAIDIAIKSMSEKYDAAQDDPWYLLYKELDQHFPGSKFILTIRDKEQWFTSCLSHFKNNHNEVREWFYGKGNSIPTTNKKDIWINRLNTHENEIKDYFKNRPDDLLILNICEGEGWEKLGPFLGVNPSQSKAFPKTNTKQHRLRQHVYEQYTKTSGFKKSYYHILLKLLNKLYIK
jgi:hypothetical protein